MKPSKVKKGDSFGRWVVVGPSAKPGYVRCLCSCGTKRDVLVQNLIQGKSRSCGCMAREKARENLYREMDQKVLGHEFGRLTPIKRTSKEGLSKYLCRCTCGKEIEVLGSQLLAGFYRSCGCKSREGYKDFSRVQKLGTEKLANKRVEGTSLYAIQDRLQRNNSSGVRGVSWIPRLQKYRAYITLKGKQKNLGIFKNLEDAKEARKKAEEKYFKPILDKYKDRLEGEKDD